MFTVGLIELLNLDTMKKIWILVYVHHGLIQQPEIFPNKGAALKRKKAILQKFNRDYDEIEVFQKKI
jgi:hypothetical protein